jgi:Cytochrome P450
MKRSHFSEQDTLRYLYGDAITMVIAGRSASSTSHQLPFTSYNCRKTNTSSDTVAPTLVFLFYHMARYPERTQKLRAELKTVESMDDVNALQALPFLNSFINETLRLFPTTPTGGYRETPHGGIEVAGRYIPGNTTIVAPAYNIGRCEF